MPEVGFFCHSSYRHKDTPRTLKSILGELPLTNQQAQHLGCAPTQLSPYLELCCLRVSANVSYQHAEEDVELFTGIQVAAKTQQRLVHRQTLRCQRLSSCRRVERGWGKIRIRTPKGNPALGKYKGCACTTLRLSYFQDNDA